jgi:hypothetical protein
VIVYRVEIDVPGARELDGVRNALAEMDLDHADPATGRGVVTNSEVSYRDGSAVVTADLEARTPVTAAATLFAIVAGAASDWRVDQAVIRVAPASSPALDTPAHVATHT